MSSNRQNSGEMEAAKKEKHRLFLRKFLVCVNLVCKVLQVVFLIYSKTS